MCLEDEMANRVKMDAATSIEVAMAMIEADFMASHPLLNKRLEFKRLKQATHQKFTDFCTDLKILLSLADVRTMTVGDWEVFTALRGCTDKTLLQQNCRN